VLPLHSTFTDGHDALGLYTGLRDKRDKIMAHGHTQPLIARRDLGNAKYDLRCLYPMATALSVEVGGLVRGAIGPGQRGQQLGDGESRVVLSFWRDPVTGPTFH
jgi:hypothetical protein